MAIAPDEAESAVALQAFPFVMYPILVEQYLHVPPPSELTFQFTLDMDWYIAATHSLNTPLLLLHGGLNVVELLLFVVQVP
ncbi:MAG: hypothetical protein QW814_01815 [Methanothrix sp.]